MSASPAPPGKIVLRRRQPGSAAGALPAELHPVLARIYRARNLASAVELDNSLENLIPPERLKQMGRAVSLLAEALRAGRRIMVVADFDADGATGCALAVRAAPATGGPGPAFPRGHPL